MPFTRNPDGTSNWVAEHAIPEGSVPVSVSQLALSYKQVEGIRHTDTVERMRKQDAERSKILRVDTT